MGNFYKLPPIPSEYRDQLRGVSSAVEKWMDHVRNLLNNGMFPWANVSKTGSLLSDIETRPHSQLQSVLGGTDQHHVQITEREELVALDALAAGMVAKTANATYAARTITGTEGAITVTNGDGVGGDPTVDLAEVYEDLQWQISTGRVAAANFPDWVAFTTNTAEYAFYVDDYIDLAANEIPHSWKLGTSVSVHMHVTTKAANASGGNHYAKYTVYLTSADVGEVWTETSLTAELTIPDGTPALHHFLLPLGDFAMTDNLIGTQIKPRIKRIAATGGTEHPEHLFLTQLGAHYLQDTMGSRSVAEK